MSGGIGYNEFRQVNLMDLIKVGDRIVYQHNGVKTRRVTKVTRKSVIVVEGDKKARIRYDQIIRA